MELAPPWASVLLAIVLATLLFLIMLPALRRNRDLPPGPRPWPVIGNLNLLGPLPHRSLWKLSQRYGPLMSLRFGSFPVVVATSAEAARSVLKTGDLAFLDRPAVAAARYTFYESSSMMWMPYGEPWRQARKLWQTELLSARQLRSQEHVRAEEVAAMLRDIRAAAEAAAPVVVVVVRDHVHMAVLGVISRMVLGRKYVAAAEGPGAGSAATTTTTPEEFRWMIDELFFLNGVVDIGDMVPWLGWLDLNGYVARMKKVSERIDAFLERVLEEHEERRRREGGALFAARDMVDLLLQLAGDPGLSVPLTRDGVKATTLELIAAATDTTVSSVEWAMSELLRNPPALGKATEELDRAVGRGRAVREGDVAGLPYLDAVVRETMRLHPVSPLLTPRVCREDGGARVGGYRVPRGTRVHVNVWAIARDPELWDAPDQFRPERFLPGSGGRAAAVDVRGRDFELLPFGAGRRMCPGMGLGLRMVHLALASLLHAFEWRLPDGVAPGELDMEEVVMMTMRRKAPLRAVAEPKLPDHLYSL